MAGERVLIIDDGRDIRDFLSDSILKPAGYQVSTAEDGVLGLQRIQRDHPDLVILDWHMPRMTGTDVMRALRQNGYNDVPVIMATAEGSEQLAVDAFRLGVRDYLVKPFDVDQLLVVVRRVLDDERRRHDNDKNVQRIIALNKQLERQIQEVNTLYSIGKSVNSLLDLQQVLNRVVEAAVFITQAEEGVLLLSDPASGELFVRAAKNMDDRKAQALRFKASDSLAGQVLLTGEPVVIGGEQRLQTAYLVKAILYMPLKVHGRTIGVLGVDNQVADRVFQPRDQRLLSALADYAAIAIENARLYTATESEKSKFEAILRQTGDAVIVCNPEGRLILFNQAAAQVFDLPATAIGLPLTEVFSHETIVELFARAGAGKPVERAEILLGEGRVFNAHMSTVPNVGRVIVMQDITHLKELDRVKSEFVSTVSHDLRSPLTSILGYVDLLDRVGPLNETQGEFVKRIKNSVQHITELITDLLDLGRIEAGLDRDMGSCELTGLVRSVVEGLRPKAEGKRQTLVLKLDTTSAPLRGNELRLKQVVTNLVDNAIKYTPESGRVFVHLYLDSDQIVFAVADDGYGIPIADQPRIFDRFFRARDLPEDIPGTGLGLAIVKSIVEGHHGRIWCESPLSDGHGTRFTLVLPQTGRA